MLIHYGVNRSSILDFKLGYSLAFIAGALNSAGFYALGFFSANMTGNFSVGADKIALGDLYSGGMYLLLPLVFILGAALAALVVELGLKQGFSRIFSLSIATEAVMLFLLGLFQLWYPKMGMGMVTGLCLLLGFQNAVVTRISNWRVRTTHVSGMSTDIGIGIGTLIATCLAGKDLPDRAVLMDNLKLHSVTVLMFALGGISGVVVYKFLGGILLMIAALLLMLAALPSLFADTRRQPGA